jgi:hypothetical protein
MPVLISKSLPAALPVMCKILWHHGSNMLSHYNNNALLPRIPLGHELQFFFTFAKGAETFLFKILVSLQWNN